VKLVFDATFGQPWVVNLRGIFHSHPRPQPTLLHLSDIIAEDEKDDPIWIPKLTKIGCVVVSADRGKHSGPFERLPRICSECGVTHILFSARMHHKASGFERARAIIVLWHDIVAACKGAPGSRYLIQATDGSFTRFALVKKST
jgi:hypothetical protein